MSDIPTPDGTGATIAQELGADPEAAKRRVEPVIGSRAADTLRDLTRAYPLTMLGVAFMVGSAFFGRKS